MSRKNVKMPIPLTTAGRPKRRHQAIKSILAQASKEYRTFNGTTPTEQELHKIISSNEYVKMALASSTEKETLNYAKKALKANRENIEAEHIVADLTSKLAYERITHLQSAVKHGTEILERSGLFQEEAIGLFWEIPETRPYMQLRYHYAVALHDAQMVHLAIEQFEDILRLDRADHLGARFYLMVLYTTLEDEENALLLHKRFGRIKEGVFLFYLSLLYFKRGNLRRARAYLKDLNKLNPHLNIALKKLVTLSVSELHETIETIDTYEVGSLEEIVTTFSINTPRLLLHTAFLQWASEQLKK